MRFITSFLLLLVFCSLSLLIRWFYLGHFASPIKAPLPVEAPSPIKAPLPVEAPSPVEANSTGEESPKGDPSRTLSPKARLRKLRQLMKQNDVQAYLIPGTDAHGNEFTAHHDNRTEWISGFSGGSGDAVVTLNGTALWTDSRFYLQAERELYDTWQLMRKYEQGVPTIQQWLSDENVDHVGFDPNLLPYADWESYAGSFGLRINITPIQENLVDKIWNDQPSYPNETVSPIEILPEEFAGESWTSKVRRVQNVIAILGGDFAVLSALDDVAWLFNMRSSEIPYLPVFRAYVVLPSVSGKPVTLYLPENKISEEVENHLKDEGIFVRIRPYDNIWDELKDLTATASTVVLSLQASYRLHNSVPAKKVHWADSPVSNLRSIKNPIEAAGMRACHVRDAVALCQMMATLENEIPLGKYWDELSVAKRLSGLRAAQNLSKGDSFEAIVAFGSHSALPHYAPTEKINVQITNDNILMIDSGGQYKDGTTDVTRIIHFGTPTNFQIDIYTRLLQGCADLAALKFPSGKTFRDIDVILRQHLYQLGLDFGHASSHGIGAYLSVHEASESVYHKNVFVSHEPGFYEDGDFGMRLENIVQVVEAKVEYISGSSYGSFLTFDTMTLVPYHRELINATKLTDAQIQWVNQYYDTIRNNVGKEMLRQGLHDTHKWLLEKTEPIKKDY